ncbi:MAG: hypothetical protein MUE73_21175, partial [Planctomycetes bacterium]|nr:hypothetical protein [Planctomycetota bacterium]
LLEPAGPGPTGAPATGPEVEPTARAAKIVGRFRLAKPRQNDAWTHPVVCRGRLYLRYHDELRAYDVRG